MKYILRRAVFAVVTLPVSFAAYGLAYFGLGLFTANHTATPAGYADNLFVVAFAHVVVITFAGQLLSVYRRVAG